MEPWQKLRVGDRIRIVQMPSYSMDAQFSFLPETRGLYKKLITRGSAQRIFQIDECGLPWIYCRFRLRNGKWEHHWLAVNDDSWVKVKKRQM
jgi:hypothetical protein